MGVCSSENMVQKIFIGMYSNENIVQKNDCRYIYMYFYFYKLFIEIVFIESKLEKEFV